MKSDFYRLPSSEIRAETAVLAVPAAFARSCVLACLLVQGCATLQPADYPKVVERRANERWGALIKGDLDTAYTYLSPATRQTTSLDSYRRSIKPGMWREARVSSVTCDGNLCKAMVDVDYDHRLMKGVQTQLTESWLIQDGNAWMVLQK
jgi:hypothetical protein